MAVESQEFLNSHFHIGISLLFAIRMNSDNHSLTDGSQNARCLDSVIGCKIMKSDVFNQVKIYFIFSLFSQQVIAATNRVDILDPALLRSGNHHESQSIFTLHMFFLPLADVSLYALSGRLDRKIEFPNPDQEARARILQIHSRKMNVR